MPSGWPLEALKAQAIAARTYALFKMHAREETSAAFDVETSVMDQVFLMPTRDDMPSAYRANVERAVSETRGLLLTTGGAHPTPLAAYFHADCGGHTEDARAVWGSASTGTTRDEGCPLNPHAQWQAHLTKAEIARTLHASTSLIDLRAIGRTSTLRVERMRFAWADGTSTELSPHEFRMALGHDRVKSTNFELAAIGDGFTLSGKGSGHGVGLCQWGARHLAKAGSGYREILKHYYPRTQLIEVAALERAKSAIAWNAH
jgi:stage II sporulation protein D